MIEQISAAIPDPALGDAILPWASVVGSFGLHAEALSGAYHLVIEASCPVGDQIETQHRLNLT